MDKRFAIFDMDGTLVDSMAYWRNLASEFLESNGIPEVSPAVSERIRPMTMTESAALFIEEYGLSGTSNASFERVDPHMNKNANNCRNALGRFCDCVPPCHYAKVFSGV